MSERPPNPVWSDLAPWYDELLSAGSGPHDTALEALLAPAQASRVINAPARSSMSIMPS